MESAEQSQPRSRGRPAGKRGKTAWDERWHRTRQARAADSGCSDAVLAEQTSACASERDAATQEDLLFADASQLQLIAAAFWSTDYKPIFDAEFVANEQECGGQVAVLAPTSYRRRLSGAAAERYDVRRRSQQRDEMAIKLHSNNQQHWSPSLLARSIAYYGKVSRFVQQNEGLQRRIASKPTVRRFLHMMKALRCAWLRCVKDAYDLISVRVNWDGVGRGGVWWDGCGGAGRCGGYELCSCLSQRACVL